LSSRYRIFKALKGLYPPKFERTKVSYLYLLHLPTSYMLYSQLIQKFQHFNNATRPPARGILCAFGPDHVPTSHTEYTVYPSATLVVELVTSFPVSTSVPFGAIKEARLQIWPKAFGTLSKARLLKPTGILP
jgi:hypothetical protein